MRPWDYWLHEPPVAGSVSMNKNKVLSSSEPMRRIHFKITFCYFLLQICSISLSIQGLFSPPFLGFCNKQTVLGLQRHAQRGLKFTQLCCNTPMFQCGVVDKLAKHIAAWQSTRSACSSSTHAWLFDWKASGS